MIKLIPKKILDYVRGETVKELIYYEPITAFNAAKILNAFTELKISDSHFSSSTGYGYNDIGRIQLDELFARVFNTEAGLVRSQIVSGTHAIYLALSSVLCARDELVCLTGTPYDTLKKAIGVGSHNHGSLIDQGISYQETNIRTDIGFDYDQISQHVSEKTKAVLIQRSRGYQWTNALSMKTIGEIIQRVKSISSDIICVVDNCYGEFMETMEPSEAGADLVAGSLIKNPGGGLAPGGGYLVGKYHLIEDAAERLTAPGLGREVGATLLSPRLYYQGIFMAPQTVLEAIASSIFACHLADVYGFTVLPKINEKRHDIIQGIKLGSPEKLIAFCQGLQKKSPIDSHVLPIPWDMPGYSDQIIMAAGTFIQGSSIELSADGPLREPYTVYLQGGLSRYYSFLAIQSAMEEMMSRGLVSTEPSKIMM